MENCEHKEIENIDSKYTVGNCNLITQQCKKCKSFATELSGGVEWKDKTYEGDRWDNNKPHQITYKVTNYK